MKLQTTTTDYPHHRGLSFSHAEVNGFNFRASDPSRHDAKSGAIRLHRVVRPGGGAPSETAEVVFDWLDLPCQAIRLAPGLLAPGLEEPGPNLLPVPGRTGPMTGSAGYHAENEFRGKRADRPDDPHHPAWWLARGCGLFAANPFGAPDFSSDQSARGAYAAYERGGR
jgi:hypothetical protein